MKRIATLLPLLCVITLTVLISGSRAQQDAARAHAKPAPAQDGKIAIPCPAELDDITDCPDTGCRPSVDPHLNRQKNIGSLDGEAEPMTIQEMKDLPDPVEGFESTARSISSSDTRIRASSTKRQQFRRSKRVRRDETPQTLTFQVKDC